jgi:hypothetical protein
MALEMALAKAIIDERFARHHAVLALTFQPEVVPTSISVDQDEVATWPPTPQRSG